MTLVRLVFDELDPSPELAGWLASEQVVIALTKGSALCLLGTAADGSLAWSEHSFGGCLGVTAVGSQTVLLATRYQIWRFENALEPGDRGSGGEELLLLPQTAWTTGAVAVRDLALTAGGEIVFVNGAYSCVCVPSDRLSFEPRWLPPFISALEPQDRCHLTGLALAADGRPGFVTSTSRADAPDGWRDQRASGGVLVSVPDGNVLAAGLAMPCSPVADGGRLWFCAGGAGALAVLDLASGAVTTVAELPGFARGLALHGDRAIVATSSSARDEDFDGLPLGGRLRRAGTDPDGSCGLFVVNTRSGEVEHQLRLAGGNTQIHALTLLHGARSAAVVGFAGDEAQELISIPTNSTFS